MISVSQRDACSLIMQNYANEDTANVFDSINALVTILGVGDEKNLRDEFAAAALAASIGFDQSDVGFWATGPQMVDAAKQAYCWADAMLEARKQ